MTVLSFPTVLSSHLNLIRLTAFTLTALCRSPSYVRFCQSRKLPLVPNGLAECSISNLRGIPILDVLFLSRAQLYHWTQQAHWQDGDSSWVSPLESAATLGIAKTFECLNQ